MPRSPAAPRQLHLVLDARAVRRWALVLLALLVAIPAALVAVSLPHSFTNGTLADAAAVNENFTALATTLSGAEATLAGHTNRFTGFGVHTAWFRTDLPTSCGTDCQFTNEKLQFAVARTSTVVVHFATSGYFTTEGAHAYWTVRGSLPGLPEEPCITMGGSGQWHQSCSGFTVARNVPPGNYALWFRAYAGALGGSSLYGNGNAGRRLLVEVFPEG